MTTMVKQRRSDSRPRRRGAGVSGARSGTRDLPGGLSHVDASGRAQMVDVSAKAPTVRQAVARGEVHVQPDTLAKIKANAMAKGDVLAVAQVAGVMAAKRTDELIPLTHPLPLTGVGVTFRFNEDPPAVEIEATVTTVAPTGVEMEALAAVAAAALTVYDMCKAVDRGMTVDRIRLVRKTGGRSGSYVREGEA